MVRPAMEVPTRSIETSEGGAGSMKAGTIRIGVIGAGGFGLYALQHFTQIPGVNLVGMAGPKRKTAFSVPQRFGISALEEFHWFGWGAEFALIYNAIPPFFPLTPSVKRV